MSKFDLFESAVTPSDDFLEGIFGNEKTEQKTKAEIDHELGSRPVLTFQEIRDMFNKNPGKALFPSQLYRSHTQPRKQESRTDESPVPMETTESGLPASPVPASPVPASPAPAEAEEKATPQHRRLTDEEFMAMAELHHCKEGIMYFREGKCVDVVINPEDANVCVIMRNLALTYEEKQRAILLVYKSKSVRYLRIADINQIDSSSSTVDNLKNSNIPQDLKNRPAIKLNFVSTIYPMFILLNSDKERDYFFSLLIFLRQLVVSTTPLKVLA